MKPDVKVDCFFFQIRKPKSPGRANEESEEPEYMLIDELESNKMSPDGTIERYSFSTVISAYVGSFDNSFVVQTNSGRALNLDTSRLTIQTTSNVVSGWVKAGTSGTGSFLTQRSNAEEVDFERTTEHVESRDYAFCFWLPEGKNYGVLLVQGLSIFSIATTMSLHFKKFIKDKYGLITEYQKYIPQDYIDRIQNESKVDEISITKYEVASDDAESLTGYSFFEGERITMVLTLKRVSSYSDQLKRAFIRPDEQTFFLGLTDVLRNVGFDDESIRSVRYDVNGKKVTAKSSNNYDFIPNFYAEDGAIEYEESTNMPTKESVEMFIFDVLEIIQERARSTNT